MAHEIKLEVLTFGLRTARKSKDKANLLRLSDIQGVDFYDCFIDYLVGIGTNLEKHDMYSSALRLRPNTLVRSKSGRTFRGILEAGHYGIESELENINTSKIKKKELEDVEKIPFYFLAFIPKDLNVGILILQRFGMFGATTILKGSLWNFVKDRFSDVSIDFNPFVSKELARQFVEDGGIKEIVLTKYNLPSDKVDRLGLTEYEEDILSIQIRIKAKRDRVFRGLNKNLKKFVNDSDTVFLDTKDIRAMGFDGTHKVSVVSDVSGVRRTVDLSHTGQIRPYYDIHNDVDKEKSGHPKFASIDKIASSMLKEFIREI